MKNAQALDFQEINNAVLANPSYLQRRIPDSHFEGKRLHADNLNGGNGRSFNLDTETGAWYDQATNERGGDAVSLVAAQENIGQGDAARLIAGELGLDIANSLTPKKLARKELPEFPHSKIDWSNPAAFFLYHNPDGTLQYAALRFEDPGYRKTYRLSLGAFQPGKWDSSGIGNTIRILYNLPEVLKSDFVIVVEGENKADALSQLGLCATCNVGGAGKWKDEYSEVLQGKDVLILPDNDGPGQKHTQQVAVSLQGKAKSIKILDLPGLPEKGDIIDWLKVPGNDVGNLRALMNSAPEWKPKNEASPRFMSAENLLQLELKPREHILYPVLPEQGTAMLFAPRGIGKTRLAMSMAFTVACGGVLFSDHAGPKWYTSKPRKVLYLDGELPLVETQERVRAIIESSPLSLQPGYFNLLNPEMLPIDEIMPSLAKIDGQTWLNKQLEGIELLVIDNLATLCGNGRENETDSWLPVQKWLLQLRRRGVSVLVVHHAGKNGDQRGTSAREDILDTVIKMSRPEDYIQEEDGARFIVDFTKARSISKGTDLAPFEASLTTNSGKLAWLTKDIGQDEMMAVVALTKQGKSVRAIAAELGASAAKIQRRQAKAKKLGIL